MSSRHKRRDSHIFTEDPLGFYPEPSWCSERLFAVEPFGPPHACVLDPAAGWGRIPRAAAAAGFTAIASDITDRLDRYGIEHIEFHTCDFLEQSPVPSIGSIVSNPPFRHSCAGNRPHTADCRR